MKSDQVTKELKDSLSVATNEEIMPALQTALAGKAAPPLGTTIYISGGQLFPPVIFGLSTPPRLAEIEALQQALRRVAEALDQDKVRLIRAELTAEIKADAPAEL